MAAGEGAEAARGGEHEEGDVDVAEDGELVGLLDEAVPALGEGDVPVRVVLDPLDRQLYAPHRRRRHQGEAARVLRRTGGRKKRGRDGIEARFIYTWR